MALKQLLQNLFERLGLTEPPAPPPQLADVPLSDPQQLRPIFSRLAAWGVPRLNVIIGDEPQSEDLLQAARQALQLGLSVGVRGRASDLARAELLSELAAAGVCEIEIPFLSAIGEVHDALAGASDYRSALRTMDIRAGDKLTLAAQIVLVPSTWKTIERTLQLIEDRGVRELRFWAIACRDDEPSSWAISANELIAAAQWIEQAAAGKIKLSWHPPRRFDPVQTLARQVRRGPRAAADAVRVEPDGRVILPIGPETSAGNVLQEDWKSIARSEVIRGWKRRRTTAVRCAKCPGLAACEGGCLADVANWVEG